MVPTFILADNQDITRAGLQRYLAQIWPASESAVIEVEDKRSLVAALLKCEGNAVVLLDYTLFDFAGTDDLLVVTGRFPNSHWLLFSTELGEKLIRRLSVEPHIGMLLKDNSGDEIRSALKCALQGERFFCHQIVSLLQSASAKSQAQSLLTPTEVEVLRLIACGKSVKEIASQRNSSIHTIITHKKNIFRKLEINNVHEATKYALRAGLVEMMEYYI